MSEAGAFAGLEPEALRDAARRLLERRTDRRAVLAADAREQALALRAAMVDLGWMLLTLPAEADGLAQSLEAAAPIYQELGRALSPVPIAPSLAAAEALAAAPAGQALLSKIAAGEAVFAVARADGLATGDGFISGRLAEPVEARDATHLLLLPATGEGTLLVVDLSASGVSRSPAPMWDPTRAFEDLAFERAPATPLLSGAAAGEAARRAAAHLDLAVACDSIGGADAVLEMTVAYLGVRRQFDRPIGAFQALKHRAADLKVSLELARALTEAACAAFAGRAGDWAADAAQARLMAADAYAAIAEDAVQLHGGIGFTWAHECHLFLKRALLNQVIGGAPDRYRDRLAPVVLRRAWTNQPAARG